MELKPTFVVTAANQGYYCVLAVRAEDRAAAAAKFRTYLSTEPNHLQAEADDLDDTKLLDPQTDYISRYDFDDENIRNSEDDLSDDDTSRVTDQVLVLDSGGIG